MSLPSTFSLSIYSRPGALIIPLDSDHNALLFTQIKPRHLTHVAGFFLPPPHPSEKNAAAASSADSRKRSPMPTSLSSNPETLDGESLAATAPRASPSTLPESRDKLQPPPLTRFKEEVRTRDLNTYIVRESQFFGLDEVSPHAARQAMLLQQSRAGWRTGIYVMYLLSHLAISFLI